MPLPGLADFVPQPQTFYGGPTAPQGGPPTYQQQAAPPPAYTQQPVAPTPQIYGAPAIQVITPQPQPQPQPQVQVVRSSANRSSFKASPNAQALCLSPQPPPAYQQQMVQVQGNQPSQQQIAQQQLAAKQAEVSTTRQEEVQYAAGSPVLLHLSQMEDQMQRWKLSQAAAVRADPHSFPHLCHALPTC